MLGLVWPPPDEDALRVAVAGRVVLITGASRGIGAASARRLATAGAVVLLVARSTADLELVRNDVHGSGGEAHAYSADLADRKHVATLLTRLRKDHDYVDVVIDGAIKSYGALTGNDADDKTLMDWLVKEYRKSL